MKSCWSFFQTWLQTSILATATAFLLHSKGPLTFLHLPVVDRQPKSCPSGYVGPDAGLEDFYSGYLCQHVDPRTKLLHFVATFNALVFFLMALFRPHFGRMWCLMFGLVQAYFLAWVSHAVFENNVPLTFSSPLFSFVSDWLMFSDILRGRLAVSH